MVWLCQSTHFHCYQWILLDLWAISRKGIQDFYLQWKHWSCTYFLTFHFIFLVCANSRNKEVDPIAQVGSRTKLNWAFETLVYCRQYYFLTAVGWICWIIWGTHFCRGSRRWTYGSGNNFTFFFSIDSL